MHLVAAPNESIRQLAAVNWQTRGSAIAQKASCIRLGVYRSVSKTGSKSDKYMDPDSDPDPVSDLHLDLDFDCDLELDLDRTGYSNLTLTFILPLTVTLNLTLNLNLTLTLAGILALTLRCI